MRIKIMAPKSSDGNARATAMKAAASKLYSTNKLYSADIDLRPENNKGTSLNLSVTKKITEHNEPSKIDMTNQLILHERNSEKTNLCSSDQGVLGYQDEPIQITEKYSESVFATGSNRSVEALKENVTQQPNVVRRDMQVEDIDSKSPPPPRKDSRLGYLSAAAMLSEMAKKSRLTQSNLTDQPNAAQKEIDVKDLASDSVLLYKKAKKGEACVPNSTKQPSVICLYSEDHDVPENSISGLLLPKKDEVQKLSNEQTDVIYIDSEDDDIATNSPLWVEDSRSGILWEDALQNKKVKRGGAPASNMNEQSDVISLDSEDDDIVSLPLLRAEDSKSRLLLADSSDNKKAEALESYLNGQSNVKCLNLDDDDIDSNSLPPVYFSEKEAQEAMSNKLKFADYFKQERQTLIEGGIESESLSSVTPLKRKLEKEKDKNSGQPHVAHQNPKVNDLQTEHVSVDSKKSKTSNANINKQSNGACMEHAQDSPVVFPPSDTSHHKKSKKTKELESIASKQSNGIRQDLEVDDIVIDFRVLDTNSERLQETISVVSHSEGLPNEGRHDSKVSSIESASLSPAAYLIKKYERDRTCNLNSIKQLNVARKELENDILQLLDYPSSDALPYKKTKKSKVSKPNFTEPSNTTYIEAEVDLLDEQAKIDIILNKQPIVVLHDLADSEYQFGNSSTKTLNNKKGNKKTTSKQKLIEQPNIPHNEIKANSVSTVLTHEGRIQVAKSEKSNGTVVLDVGNQDLSASYNKSLSTTASHPQKKTKIGKSIKHRMTGQHCVPHSDEEANSNPLILVGSLDNEAEKLRASELSLTEPVNAVQQTLKNDKSQSRKSADDTMLLKNKIKKSTDSLPINLRTPNVTCQNVNELRSGVNKLQSGVPLDDSLSKKAKKCGVSEPNLTKNPNVACDELCVNSELDKPHSQYLSVAKFNTSKQSNVDSNEVDLQPSFISVDTMHHQKKVKDLTSYSPEQYHVVRQEQESDNINSNSISAVQSNKEQFQEAEIMALNCNELLDVRIEESSTIGINLSDLHSQSKTAKEKNRKHEMTEQSYVPSNDLEPGKTKLNSQILGGHLNQDANKSKISKRNLIENRNVTLQAMQIDSVDSNSPPPFNCNDETPKQSEAFRLNLADHPNDVTTQTDLHNNQNPEKIIATNNNRLDKSSTLPTHARLNESSTSKGNSSTVYLNKDSILNQSESDHEILEAAAHHDVPAESRSDISVLSQKLDEILERLQTVQEKVQWLTEAQKKTERFQIEMMKEILAIKNQNKGPEILENWLVENDINLPMQSMDEFRKYCTLLEQTSECRKILETSIHYLINGKQSLSRNIASVIRKYFAPELACQFTAVKSVKQKFVLAETSFYNHLLDIFVQKSLTGVFSKRERDFNKGLGEALCSFKDLNRSRPAQQTGNESNINVDNV